MLKKISAIAAFALTLALTPAPSAEAYDKVCLRLKVGAGYVARLWVKFADGSRTGAVNIPVNAHKCRDISHIPPGQRVDVYDSAVGGNTRHCGYFIQNPIPVPITYYAHGTSLSHHCGNRP